MHSTMVASIDPARVKELMAERGLDVPALADAAGVTPKTVYTLLAGLPVSLATTGKVYRALGGNRTGFFAAVRPNAEAPVPLSAA